MTYFPAILLALAVLTAAADTRLSGRTPTDSLLRWLLFCSVGLGSLWGFVGHAFFAQRVAESIGWKTSPFQFEVAVANLGFGVLGVLCPWRSRGFQAATVIGISCFGFGAAFGHARQMIVAHNFAPNNAGVIFWTDMLVPLALLVLLCIRAKREPLAVRQ